MFARWWTLERVTSGAWVSNYPCSRWVFRQALLELVTGSALGFGGRRFPPGYGVLYPWYYFSVKHPIRYIVGSGLIGSEVAAILYGITTLQVCFQLRYLPFHYEESAQSYQYYIDYPNDSRLYKAVVCLCSDFLYPYIILTSSLGINFMVNPALTGIYGCHGTDSLSILRLANTLHIVLSTSHYHDCSRAVVSTWEYSSFSRLLLLHGTWPFSYLNCLLISRYVWEGSSHSWPFSPCPSSLVRYPVIIITFGKLIVTGD